jgi:hypothetical protein
MLSTRGRPLFQQFPARPTMVPCPRPGCGGRLMHVSVSLSETEWLCLLCARAWQTNAADEDRSVPFAIGAAS